MDIRDLDIVPQKPGVYLWKNKFNTIIYVGKAKNLRSRMKQYFKGMQNSYKTQKLVSLIEAFEYIITSTDKEALILERNLIEKYAPEFNILLTDDKRYPYIKISLKEILEINMVFRVKSEREKAFYFGPFPTGFGARRMLNLLTRLALYEKGLPIKNLTSEQWKDKFNYVKSLLGSSSDSLIKELNNKMNEAALNMHYEIAHDIKESLDALTYYKTNQAVELQDKRNIDIIAFVQKNNYLSIALLFYRQGILLSKKEIVVEVASTVEETSRQFLSQYYNINIKPDLIVSNFEVESELEVFVPQKAQLKHVLDIALQNAEDNIDLKLQSFVRKEEITLGALKELGTLIGLEKISHILMIDNSNTNNTLPVSAIVSYRNGIKSHQEFRKYKVEVNKRAADVEYMKQGVLKYFSNSSNPIPDLFIVDGGVAQVNEIKKIIPNIPLIGLVKNDRHTTEALIDLHGKRIELQSGNLLNFLRNMQEEVDRYAKNFHNKKRKTTLEGKLITIEGVGPKIEAKLLEHFKTYSAIYNASEEDLQVVVSAKVASEIRKELDK